MISNFKSEVVKEEIAYPLDNLDIWQIKNIFFRCFEKSLSIWIIVLFDDITLFFYPWALDRLFNTLWALYLCYNINLIVSLLICEI